MNDALIFGGACQDIRGFRHIFFLSIENVFNHRLHYSKVTLPTLHLNLLGCFGDYIHAYPIWGEAPHDMLFA